MSLLQLQIQHLRNISNLDLNFHPQFNFIYGNNGSGKTSILEGIYLLGHGRSFRSRLINPIINHDAQQLTVFAQCVQEDQSTVNIGIERSRKGDNRYRLANENVASAAELAAVLPIKLINPHSYKLLESGPQYRRQFLDWGLFHVEHDFYKAWKQLNRVLKQRNAVLRQGGDVSQVKAWDEELISLSKRLHGLRQGYMTAFLPIFEQVFADLLQLEGLLVKYRPGWRQEDDFEEVLQRSLPRDRQLGYTQFGAHRADLRISVKGISAAEVLSRGQSKLLVNAMILAQGILLNKQSGKRCVYLIDDMAAELDINHRRHMAHTLGQLGAQVFVTAVDQADLMDVFDTDGAMFHVEHGFALRATPCVARLGVSC